MLELLPACLSRRFEPLRTLGEGGFGRVVLARDRDLDRLVAIKSLVGCLREASDRSRFEREARVTARLVHPHIVGVHDHGVSADDEAFIVYEYVDGRSLQELIRDPSALGPERVVRWARELAEALAFAHREGVVHRDVKPGNILVRAHVDSAVLCDFGLARSSAADRSLTAEGILLGSPAFMAPELWRGEVPSPSSDQFAWGATILALLGGGLVFGSESPGDILAGLPHYQPPRPPEGSPEELSRLVVRALAREPVQRWRDMVEVVDQLTDELPGSAGAPGTGTRMARTLPRAASPGSSPTIRLETPDAPLPRVPGCRPVRSSVPPEIGRTRCLSAAVLLVLAVILGWTLTPSTTQEPSGRPSATNEIRPSPEAEIETSWQDLTRRRDDLLEVLEIPRREVGWESLRRRSGEAAPARHLSDPRLELAFLRFLEGMDSWFSAVDRSEHLDLVVTIERAQLGIGLASNFLSRFNRVFEHAVRKLAFGQVALGQDVALVAPLWRDLRASVFTHLDGGPELSRLGEVLRRILTVELAPLADHPDPYPFVLSLTSLPRSRLPRELDSLALMALLDFLFGDEAMLDRACPSIAAIEKLVEVRLGERQGPERAAFECEIMDGLRLLELRRPAPCGNDRLDPAPYEALLERTVACLSGAPAERILEQARALSRDEDMLVRLPSEVADRLHERVARLRDELDLQAKAMASGEAGGVR